MLGAQSPDGDFEFYFGMILPISKLFLSQICTAYYFLHFLVITPLVGLIEKPLALPQSIATAVLAKNGSAPAVRAKG